MFLVGSNLQPHKCVIHSKKVNKFTHLFQDYELSPMHGANAFKEFIDKGEKRRPDVSI